ncbi:MAG: pseudouridine synthase [Bacteroidota bacterium]
MNARRHSRNAPASSDVVSPVRHERVAQDEPVRLNKYIAQAGLCSRREADAWIAAGRVSLDGETVTALGVKVTPRQDVRVDGRLISPKRLAYVLLNKAKDTITTTDDEHDRRTVLDVLPAEFQDLFPVGRLDRDTTGALLLTNDGDLAHRLMHPRYEIEKIYLVKTRASVKPHQLEQLRAGVTLEDGPARADMVAYPGERHDEVALSLHEGRNRQVRRMVEALGHEVVALDRVRYAGLTLSHLRRGRWRRLAPHEINGLRRAVKLKAIVA